MIKRHLKSLWLPLFAATLWFAGCADQVGRLIGPDDAALGKTGTTNTTSQWSIVREFNPAPTRNGDLVIDSAGGTLTVAGHRLVVPAGAVTQPTLFSMHVASPDSTGVNKISVMLYAYQKDSQGRYRVNVGGNGFLVPVELSLNYAAALAVGSETGLSVLYLSDSEPKPVPLTTQVDVVGKRATAKLPHFSSYALGWPN